MKKFCIVIIIAVIISVGAFLLYSLNKSNNRINELESSIANNVYENKIINDIIEDSNNNKATEAQNNNTTEKITENEIENLNSNNIENREIEPQEGYEIIVSKKDITIEKGSETSFVITFTNPDESSIREYITCKDQSDIILVKYSMLENKKITVEVEALKVGVTEIVVSDYNYPDMKEIVKVNVVEAN